jgi:hypothetical protein
MVLSFPSISKNRMQFPAKQYPFRMDGRQEAGRIIFAA